MLPAVGSTSLEGPLDDKCVLVPGRGRRCPVDIPAARGTQPVRNRAGPRGLLNAGEKRTGAPHGEWDLQLPGSSVPPRGSRPPPHYLLPGTRWTAISPFKSPKGGRHLPLCVLLLWPSPSPPPTAVAPRADRNRRPGAWREALDLPAAGAGCSGAAGETLGLEVVRSGLRSNGVTRPWRFSSAHPSQLCQTRGSPGPSCTGSEPSPWQVAPASFPDPSLFLARRLPLSRGHLPFPPSSASRFHASLGRSKVS